jgi:hypothetical protein
MILTLLHYAGFALAFGGWAAVLVLMARAKASPEAAPHIRPAIRPIATVGLTAIGLLWLTGIPMWIGRHGASMDLGGSWHLKLTAAAVLTALAAMAWGRMRAGRPLPPPVARGVLVTQLAAALTAMAAAIATFGG